MQAKIKQAKQYIEDAHIINIALPASFQKDSFPAALALFYTLKELGKNVNVLDVEKYPRKFAFLTDEHFSNSPQADFVIKIKEGNAEFSDLSYEKTSGGLSLFLKTKNGELKPEDIVLTNLKKQALPGPAEEDLLITVGIADFKTAERFLHEPSSPILNIDIEPDNEEYGDLNLINTNTASISEIIFDLVSALQDNEESFLEQTANCLLAGIIYATNNLQSNKITSGTFYKINCLSNAGANLQTVRSELFGSALSKGAIRIFGKVLGKIQVLENPNIAFAGLSKQDFIETKTSSADLKFALRKLFSGLFPFEHILLLWQQQSSPLYVRGVFYSSNKNLLKKISAKFQAQQKGETVLFKTEKESLSLVKDQILEVINQ